MAPNDHQAAAAVVPNVHDADAQIELDGHAERVEAAAEIGDGSGNDDLARPAPRAVRS